MRNLYWIFLIGWLATVPVHAQSAFWRTLFSRGKQTQTQVTARTQHINISKKLDQRVTRTYRKALQEQQADPTAYRTMPFGEPINGVLHPAELNPHLLYPEQDFLVTAQQTASYLAARNNVLVRNELRRAAQLHQELETVLPTLEQAAITLKQPDGPDAFVPWLVQQIPPQTHYLFIGEEHGYPDIHNLVTNLLVALRTKYPDRSILMFTEFLPSELAWPVQGDFNIIPEVLHQHFPIWDSSLEQNIPVIGLEPNFAIIDQCKVRHSHLPWYRQRESVWSTLEGVRIRNDHWKTTLDKYRAQFPDALFIIYAGADHCMYNRPFALPNEYNPQDTFVATLHPASHTVYRSNGFLKIALETQVPASGPLERITHTEKFPQPALAWKDPQLIRISGFDVRLKIPITFPPK